MVKEFNMLDYIENNTMIHSLSIKGKVLKEDIVLITLLKLLEDFFLKIKLKFISIYSFISFSPLYSFTRYNGLFFVSLKILPKYSPTIPNNKICTPEKNNISIIIA